MNINSIDYFNIKKTNNLRKFGKKPLLYQFDIEYNNGIIANYSLNEKDYNKFLENQLNHQKQKFNNLIQEQILYPKNKLERILSYIPQLNGSKILEL